MIKAIMFDFDGVIVESANIKTQAFREMFQGYPEHIDSIVNYHIKNMGLSRYEKFRHIYEKILCLPLSKEHETKLGEEFSKIVLNKVLNAPFVPGALEFLSNYYRYYYFFLVSGTPKHELLKIAKEKNINKFFQEVHGSPPGKSEIVKDILRRFKLLSSEVLFVGDAESDYNTAQSNELMFVARKSSETTIDLIEKSNYWIEDLQDLQTALLEL